VSSPAVSAAWNARVKSSTSSQTSLRAPAAAAPSFGEHRIVFGSDSVWYGGPQWQIEALWRFQIPDVFPASGGGGTRSQFGYPQITESAKRKILGLNNARLYGIRNTDGRLTNDNSADCRDDDDRHDHDRDDERGAYHPVPSNYASLIPVSLKRTMEYAGFATDDRLSRYRREYLAAGANPRHTRFGWTRARSS